MSKIELMDGKYTVVNELEEGGGFRALRYGEEWRNLVGDNLVLSMAYEIEYLREGLLHISEYHQFDSPADSAEVAKYYLEGRTD